MVEGLLSWVHFTYLCTHFISYFYSCQPITDTFQFLSIAIQFYFWQKSPLTLSIQLHSYGCKTTNNFSDNTEITISIYWYVIIFTVKTMQKCPLSVYKQLFDISVTVIFKNAISPSVSSTDSLTNT